jgi:hypothetical protein
MTKAKNGNYGNTCSHCKAVLKMVAMVTHVAIVRKVVMVKKVTIVKKRYP